MVYLYKNSHKVKSLCKEYGIPKNTIFSVEEKLIIANNTYKKLKELDERNLSDSFKTIQIGMDIFYTAFKQL